MNFPPRCRNPRKPPERSTTRMTDAQGPQPDRVSFLPFTLVLAAVLLMLAEYVLIGWTQNYGADHDVLSHVGFAGTIVSMILGVVAIIYAFYQGFAQQRDAQALAGQLSDLRRVLAPVRL